MKQQILSLLAPGHPWGELLHYHDIIDSTNTQAKKLALQGAPHGTVVIAGQQNGGRGRMGRSFHSPAGSGLYLSAIIRPDCAAGELMHLTCAAAVAACDAIEAVTGLRTGIKWINDLVCGSRKVAGILTELVLEPGSGKVSAAVIGIGINCRQTQSDFPPELHDIAGSLAMAAGQDVSPAAVAAAVIEQFRAMGGQLLCDKAAIMTRYRSRCITIGKEVALHRGDTVTHGHAVGVDDDGALLVENENGIVQPVNSGEASVRGLYGYV